MDDSRMAWLAFACVVASGIGVWGGCSDTNETTGSGVCGNGIPEAGEQCDDGNTADGDGCSQTCQLPSCGDGVVNPGEECDDGNSVNDDGCDNDCKLTDGNCGNGVVDDGEECDDGNDVDDDACTNACTEPRCGDGIVQAGEDCDDGNTEFGDDCPADCRQGGEGGGCQGQQILAGMVTNDQNPTQSGEGIPSRWSYAGGVGITAGNDMCSAIGADHPCTYQEVVDAEASGEFETQQIPVGQEFWLHRVYESVPRLSDNTAMTDPGGGGRCNDWEYPTNHISDGEFGIYDPSGSYSFGRKIGDITYFFDDDTEFTGMNDSGSTTTPVGGDHSCDANAVNASDPNGIPGCAGGCGNADPKAILCCYAACE